MSALKDAQKILQGLQMLPTLTLNCQATTKIFMNSGSHLSELKSVSQMSLGLPLQLQKW